MNNPFVYGKQVSGYQFYDRHEVGEELAGYLREQKTFFVPPSIHPVVLAL